jgi:hypothetical protein
MKTLKNLFILTLVLFVTFSCDNDDEEQSEEETTSKLIGTWKFTSSTTDGVPDTDFYICDLLDLLIFTQTTVTSKYYEDPSGTNGSNCVETSSTENYSIDGEVITVNNYSSTIITLTNTKLVFEDIETDGTDTFIYTETYIKQ